MNLIRLPSHAIYRTRTIVRLLADSPLQSFGADRCYKYLRDSHGIAAHQIKGNFLAIRIAAHNSRVERYWRAKQFGSVHTPSLVAERALGFALRNAGREGSQEARV